MATLSVTFTNKHLPFSMTANKESIPNGAMIPQKKSIYYVFCKLCTPRLNKIKNASVPDSLETLMEENLGELHNPLPRQLYSYQ